MDTSIATTLLGEPATALPRRPAVPAMCEAGVVLRVLLFVEATATTAAAFSGTPASPWPLRAALAAAVAVPGTLIWLFATCGAKAWLARLPPAARLACVGAVGALAGWVACAPVWLVGIDLGSVFGVPAVVAAGAVLGAVVYHWLELRLRALLPLATEAGLLELQSRVQPHFLFNTLNTAIALVRVDPARAEEVLENLSELFRAALGALEGESTLGEEIRLARMYLSIESMRFGKRLAVDWDVDAGVEAARVPPLLLQPLIENAVRHGIESSDAGGRVQIRARLRNKVAWLQITNSLGPGPAHPGHGIGLASARERLALMHDFRAEFQAGPTDDGRYRVRLAVPL